MVNTEKSCLPPSQAGKRCANRISANAFGPHFSRSSAGTPCESPSGRSFGSRICQRDGLLSIARKNVILLIAIGEYPVGTHGDHAFFLRFEVSWNAE